MGLMDALKGLAKAFTAPAADPRKTFASAYDRHRGLLLQVREALVQLVSSKERLEAKTAEVQGKLPQLEEEARRALVAGREDLARLALTRRQVAVVQLQTLEQQTREVEAEEKRLSLVEQRLATQIEAFFARQEIMAARYSAAEAQVRISEAMAGVSSELDDLGLALRQAEERTEAMQARASAIDRLVEAGVLEVPGLHMDSTVERQLGQLDVTQAVEDQLAVLKHRLGEGRPPQ